MSDSTVYHLHSLRVAQIKILFKHPLVSKRLSFIISLFFIHLAFVSRTIEITKSYVPHGDSGSSSGRQNANCNREFVQTVLHMYVLSYLIFISLYFNSKAHQDM